MDKDLRALLNRVADNLDIIAKNTKPHRLFRRILEWIALLVGISGILAAIEQTIQWFRR